ncbi:MAG: membrane protein insertion efficiency factor YidD [Alphaproteobacteria bacterium]|nr:membrane protein insertion efficiency factor YidD [Alphaproteobacteria bacterium]
MPSRRRKRVSSHVLNRFCILLVRLYRAASAGRHPCCRFVPTCSAYAIEAIEKYGALRGCVLAVRRILRCRPGFRKYANCGYDPVP